MFHDGTLTVDAGQKVFGQRNPQAIQTAEKLLNRDHGLTLKLIAVQGAAGPAKQEGRIPDYQTDQQSRQQLEQGPFDRGG